MRFRLVGLPNSMTLDDLELLCLQIFSEFCATSHIWEATTAKRMKLDRYYRRQKCIPMTSFRKYCVHADIRGGSSWRGCQMTVVVDDANFWRFGWLLLRKCF